MRRGGRTTGKAAWLQAALEGLEIQKALVEEHISTVRRMLDGRALQHGGASSKRAPGKRSARPTRPPLSPEARQRIAAAQKRRWDAYRKAAAAKKS